jgi:thiosulfate reductase cytochrome b subunit
MKHWIHWLPGLDTLRRYETAWLPHDIFAGIVLATMLVPVGIAYAVASGLPGIYGLYATIVPLLVYALFGLWSGHFRKDLLPAPADRKLRAFWEVIAKYLRRTPPGDAHSYNVMQRTAYLIVIFFLFPLVIWTGLALSPAFDSAVPAAVNVLGGRQSARTLHFFVSGFLLLFVVVHVTMVVLAGFRTRMRAMITGGPIAAPERTPEPALIEVEEHP